MSTLETTEVGTSDEPKYFLTAFKKVIDSVVYADNHETTLGILIKSMSDQISRYLCSFCKNKKKLHHILWSSQFVETFIGFYTQCFIGKKRKPVKYLGSFTRFKCIVQFSKTITTWTLDSEIAPIYSSLIKFNCGQLPPTFCVSFAVTCKYIINALKQNDKSSYLTNKRIEVCVLTISF